MKIYTRDMRRLKVHPFARLLPMATPKERDRMRVSIKKVGVQVPIVLFNGEILDGRGRYEIAMELGKPCPAESFEGEMEDALDLVEALWLCRRHLDRSQLAMAAADIAREFRRMQGMERDEAFEAAATLTGAAPSTIEKAANIAERHPETAEEIRNGQETVGGFEAKRKPMKKPHSKSRPTLSHCPILGCEDGPCDEHKIRDCMERNILRRNLTKEESASLQETIEKIRNQ